MQIKLWGFVSTFLIDYALLRARMEAAGGCEAASLFKFDRRMCLQVRPLKKSKSHVVCCMCMC